MKWIAIVVVALTVLSANVSAQNKAAMQLFAGLSYEPAVQIADDGTGLVKESTYPSISFAVGDGTTSFYGRLGSISRLGVQLGHKSVYVAFSYAYEPFAPADRAHAVEAEIGARLWLGTEQRYRLLLGARAGTNIASSAFRYGPTLGVQALINK